MATIASLHVYPVKSCRGIDVASARVADTGMPAAHRDTEHELGDVLKSEGQRS